MSELYNNFFDKFCDVNKFEELGMDTDFLYLALAEKDLDECNLPSKQAEWTEKRSKDCRDDFRADAKNNFYPVLVALNTRNMTTENQDYSRRSSDAPKEYACRVKPIAVMIVKVKSKSLAVKDRTNAR